MQEDLAEGATIRRWIRSEAPTEGWWPWGLVPLLALCLLFLFAATYFAQLTIQDEVAREAKKRLDAAGYTWTEVTANGRRLRVTGEVPNDDVSETMIAAVAKTTDCATFFGPKPCPTEVDILLRRPSAAPSNLRAHSFEFERLSGIATLRGEVPSEADRDHLLALARPRFDAIKDELQVSGDGAPEAYGLACEQALKALSLLISGKTGWREGRISVSGVVIEGKEASLRRLLSVFDEQALGPISLIDEQKATACDEEFAEKLARSKINFETARADVRPASMPLLAELAAIAKACSVTLQIEGHTDSLGPTDMNDDLSLRRASSVRAVLNSMGVDNDRMVPLGFGQRRPISSNDSARGRERNRRIEIRIRR